MPDLVVEPVNRGLGSLRFRGVNNWRALPKSLLRLLPVGLASQAEGMVPKLGIAIEDLAASALGDRLGTAPEVVAPRLKIRVLVKAGAGRR